MLLPLLMNLRMLHPRWTHADKSTEKAKQSYAKAARGKKKRNAEEINRIWTTEEKHIAFAKSLEAMTQEEISAEIAVLMRKKMINDDDEAMLMIMLAAIV